MRTATLLLLSVLYAIVLPAQPGSQQTLDSMSKRVIHFLQTRNADSLYALTSQSFKDKLSKERFEDISFDQIFPMNDFKEVALVKTENGVNKYKISGTPTLQLLVGLNNEAKVETLLIQPFVEVVVDEATPGFITDSLDQYVARALVDWQIPGVALCVIKNDKIVAMKGFGLTELGTDHKVDENTLFMIGSNTKAFTATAIAMLDDEKKLSLDDLVTKWIPQFKLNNEAAGKQAIIRDLLCHRLGFMTFQGDFTYWTSNLSRTDVIEKMAHVKAVYPFRTKWGYTNAAFLTAGQIIPAATGSQWEDFVKKTIFDPLGMSRTLALSKDYPAASNKCEPYTMWEGKLVKIPYCQIDNLAPAGSISSSISDMSKWVMMQLGDGMLNGKRVVPAAAIAATRLPHSILGNGGTNFNSGHFALYGLGWFLEEYNNRKIVSHTGGVNGFVTSVTLVPEDKLGIIVLTNTDQNGFYQALKWEILDAYMKLPYRNYSKVFLSYFTTEKRSEERTDAKFKDSVALHLPSSLPLTAYVGNYASDLYGTMKVAMEHGEMRMRFSHHPAIYASLKALGGNRFYATFSDPEFGNAVFPFSVSNGKVRSVTVKVADFVEYTPYEFTRL